ncbi:hypothetical protein FOCC_FOCC006817 [Frankliniella occidentalis]|nr:hypothetical protein FOCC_FOCC006817 [Frankliniella occidentalis]
MLWRGALGRLCGCVVDGEGDAVRVLDYAHSSLHDVPPEVFQHERTLEEIRLDSNRLRDLPRPLFLCQELRVLSVQDNDIAQLPAAVGQLPQLQVLNLRRNALHDVPPELKQCKKLYSVSVQSNPLLRLPEALTQLVMLQVDNNYLDQLPESIGEASSLEELVASHNQLDVLTPCVGFLRRLQVLEIDNNSLSELPAEVGSCRALRVLSARRNRLLEVPDELGHLPRLRVLNLVENRIEFLPVSLLKLTQLQALWLSARQGAPLVQLHKEYSVDTRRRVLSCFLLPQRPEDEEEAHYQQQEQQQQLHTAHLDRRVIRFSQELERDLEPGVLLRAPTPYPKELRVLARQARHASERLQGLQQPDGEVPAAEASACAVAAAAALDVAVAAAVPEETAAATPTATAVATAATCVREARVSKPHDPATLSRTNSVLQQEQSLLATLDQDAGGARDLQEWLNGGHRYDDVPRATPTPSPEPKHRPAPRESHYGTRNGAQFVSPPQESPYGTHNGAQFVSLPQESPYGTRNGAQFVSPPQESHYGTRNGAQFVAPPQESPYGTRNGAQFVAPPQESPYGTRNGARFVSPPQESTYGTRNGATLSIPSQEPPHGTRKKSNLSEQLQESPYGTSKATNVAPPLNDQSIYCAHKRTNSAPPYQEPPYGTRKNSNVVQQHHESLYGGRKGVSFASPSQESPIGTRKSSSAVHQRQESPYGTRNDANPAPPPPEPSHGIPHGSNKSNLLQESVYEARNCSNQSKPPEEVLYGTRNVRIVSSPHQDTNSSARVQDNSTPPEKESLYGTNKQTNLKRPTFLPIAVKSYHAQPTAYGHQNQTQGRSESIYGAQDSQSAFLRNRGQPGSLPFIRNEIPPCSKGTSSPNDSHAPPAAASGAQPDAQPAVEAVFNPNTAPPFDPDGNTALPSGTAESTGTSSFSTPFSAGCDREPSPGEPARIPIYGPGRTLRESHIGMVLSPGHPEPPSPAPPDTVDGPEFARARRLEECEILVSPWAPRPALSVYGTRLPPPPPPDQPASLPAYVRPPPPRADFRLRELPPAPPPGPPSGPPSYEQVLRRRAAEAPPFTLGAVYQQREGHREAHNPRDQSPQGGSQGQAQSVHEQNKKIQAMLKQNNNAQVVRANPAQCLEGATQGSLAQHSLQAGGQAAGAISPDSQYGHHHHVIML